MPRRIADYRPSDGWTTANLISSIGAYVTGLSVLLFLLNVAVSWLRRRPAGDDPWEGQTLEWATSSPPPRFNFDRPLPPVRSPEPLMDLRGIARVSK
jgi:cytochrome c oxidase subunit 1